MNDTVKDYPLHGEDIRIMPYRVENVGWHEHDCLELVYVCGGNGIHYVDNLNADGNTSYAIKEGDCFVIDYGLRHRYETINNQPFDIINVIFYPEIVDKALAGCHSFREMTANYLIMLNTYDVSQLEYICSDVNREIRPLVDKLRSEYFGSKPGRLQILRCVLVELIITLMRTLTENFTPPNRHETTEYILKYIDKNYMNPVMLGEIAANMNYSLPYISKCFRDDMGKTFTDYLHSFRIQQSCRLLANTKNKISAIAGVCGFDDIKWFNIKFREETGITPSQYRSQKNAKRALQ
ncbi:MAG: AraC family transcriptional regulator [Candidatus Howiella sp.]